jgi:hypothetical protein
VRDGLAYIGARRRYTGDRLLTERCSQQSIRGSKWDYVRAETARRYVERRGEETRGEERRGEKRKGRKQQTRYNSRRRPEYMPYSFIILGQHSGHYMYRTVVTICTASLTFSNSTFCPHSVFVCFVWISEQTAIDRKSTRLNSSHVD